MSISWSSRIADRYRCTLPASLADWFDSRQWRESGFGEYHQPVHPETLLSPAPDCIWPGLMSADLLPLIGNASGDWLCARIDRGGDASGIIQWYHGGGDWIPWGRTIAEAILFDTVVDRLSDAPRRHAVPATSPRPRPPRGEHDPLVRWALTHLPDSLEPDLQAASNAESVARAVLDAEVAEVAVRCERILAILKQPARQVLDSLASRQRSVERETWSEWSFDLTRIPTEMRDAIEPDDGRLARLQDWEAAARHAEQVVRLAPDLAWAWDVLGYAAENRGDPGAAIGMYRRSAECSVFSDQSIRLETHWTNASAAKFSVARLKSLAPDVVEGSEYLSLLCDADVHRRRVLATEYWSGQASSRAENQQWDQACDAHFAAGWDVGAASMPAYAKLLDRLADAADHAGQAGRAELARTHLRCHRDRYPV